MSASPLQLASREGAKKSNLAFALSCLPPDRRADALTFYDFCRTVDDIADDPALPAVEKQALLDRWKAGRPEDLPPSVLSLIQRRSLDTGLLREIVLGVEMDIDPRSYETYEELKAYCWRVACAVGLVSIEIFGCHHPSSKIYAEQLGHALQLTNILRDVGEDADLGRIYLPREDLKKFGVTETSLRARRPDGDFLGLMRFEAGRAREYFQHAQAVLPTGDARALVPAEAMRATYQKILNRMTADGFQVFEKRYRVPTWEKIFVLLAARLRTLPLGGR